MRHVTILPKSSPSPEPHQRKTKERSADISSISSFIIYNSKRQREELDCIYYTPIISGFVCIHHPRSRNVRCGLCLIPCSIPLTEAQAELRQTCILSPAGQSVLGLPEGTYKQTVRLKPIQCVLTVSTIKVGKYVLEPHNCLAYMGGVLVLEMSSSFSLISSRSLGYSSNRSARPETQEKHSTIRSNHWVLCTWTVNTHSPTSRMKFWGLCPVSTKCWQ